MSVNLNKVAQSRCNKGKALWFQVQKNVHIQTLNNSPVFLLTSEGTSGPLDFLFIQSIEEYVCI